MILLSLLAVVGDGFRDVGLDELDSGQNLVGGGVQVKDFGSVYQMVM